MKPWRRLPPPGAASVSIVCTHGGRRSTTIAVFHEQISVEGVRHNIDLLRDELHFPNGRTRAKPQELKHRYNPEIVDIVSSAQTVWATLLDGHGNPLDPSIERPEDPGEYWHYTLRCPSCSQNVSARSEKLMPIIGKFLDDGELEKELSDINRMLAEQK